MRITVSFSLNSDRDSDLVSWLNGLPERERSLAIRKTLRVGLGMGNITHADLYRAIQGLGQRLQSGVIIPVVNQDDMPVEEPADIAASLDKLGL